MERCLAGPNKPEMATAWSPDAVATKEDSLQGEKILVWPRTSPKRSEMSVGKCLRMSRGRPLCFEFARACLAGERAQPRPTHAYDAVPLHLTCPCGAADGNPPIEGWATYWVRHAEQATG
jgi:hypothetical protein